MIAEKDVEFSNKLEPLEKAVQELDDQITQLRDESLIDEDNDDCAEKIEEPNDSVDIATQSDTENGLSSPANDDTTLIS